MNLDDVWEAPPAPLEALSIYSGSTRFRISKAVHMFAQSRNTLREITVSTDFESLISPLVNDASQSHPPFRLPLPNVECCTLGNTRLDVACWFFRAVQFRPCKLDRLKLGIRQYPEYRIGGLRELIDTLGGFSVPLLCGR